MVNFGGTFLHLTEIEDLDLAASGGNDLIYVTGNVASQSIDILGGTGNDRIDVRYPVGTAALNVNGGGQTDQMFVELTGADDQVTLNSTSIAVTGAVTTSYSGLSSLELRTNAGTDNVVVAGTHAGATTLLTGAQADTVNVQQTTGADAVHRRWRRYGQYPVHCRRTSVALGQGNDTATVTSTAPALGGQLTGIDAYLSINGEAGADHLVVDASGDTAGLTGELQEARILGLGLSSSGMGYFGFEDLDLQLGRGGDQLNITDTHAGTTDVLSLAGDDTMTVSGISGPTTIDTGSGDDDIIANVQLDLPFDEASRIADLLTVIGGSGIDSLHVVSGSTFEDANPLFDDIGTLTPTTITGLEMPQGIVYLGLEDLVMDLGSGRDDFTIVGTHAGTTVLNTDAVPDTSHTGTVYPGTDTVHIRAIAGTTTVHTGADNDTINVGSLAPAQGGVVDQIAALLTLNGDGGSDTINVDDTGELQPNTLHLTATTITGLDMSQGIVYGTSEFLNISLGSGGNVANIRSTCATTTVNTGSGDELIHLGSLAPAIGGGTLNLLAGALTLNGQSGNDTLYVDDTGDTTANTGSLSESRISGLGTNGVSYSNLEGMELSMGSGGNTLDITGTMQRNDFRVVTLVNTGTGNDVVAVNLDVATDGPVSINLEAGNDRLDASPSTLGLLLFGGTGADVIFAGQGDDVVFGDQGVITDRNQNNLVTTRHGIDFAQKNTSDPSSGYYVPIKLTDGQTPHSVRYSTRDELLGGSDTLYGQGGNDDIYGGTAGDIVVGGSFVAGKPDGDDRLDGGDGPDAIAGDNALITFRTDSLDPRMQVLTGTLIYGVTPGVNDGLPLVNNVTPATAVYADPAGGTQYSIQLLDHGTSTDARLFGDDYVAGGAGNDEIFGQLGNDILQGDASILNLTDGDPATRAVSASPSPAEFFR